MKQHYLILLLILAGCAGKNNEQMDSVATTSVTTNDTIPTVRKQVSKTAVASYIIPINNPLLKQYFGVKVFETPQTFHYLLQMQYEGVLETDTLKIPNFGIWPTVQVKKGPEKMSCIIGFLDKQKNFKEYKMLVAKNDKLKLVVLKRYAVGVYSDTK